MKPGLLTHLFLWLAQLSPLHGADPIAPILSASGVKGGLVVLVRPADERLAAQLRNSGPFVVDELKNWRGRELPYIDNLVNLLVADNHGDVPTEEVMRVLAPGGVAWIGGKKLVKPRPKEMDDWTHFLHGPDNNAVSRDTLVGPPFHLQWLSEPLHSRSHQFLTSISAMVSAGGRLFYIVDEGPLWLHEFLPARWSLVAKDAFNGVTLWKRPISSWQPAHQAGRIAFPPDLYRRLVAVGDRVYATMSIFGPVEALDAATGATLRTYAGTEKTEELICHDGVLFCVVAVAEPQTVDRRALGFQRAQPTQKRLVAVRAETGKILWSKQDDETFAYQPLTLIAQGNRVLFQNPSAIYCLEATTGKPLWRRPQPSVFPRPAQSTPTLLIADGVVLCADRYVRTQGRVASAQLVALSADTGRELWRCECAEGHSSPPEVFVINGQVWCGEVPAHKTQDFRTVRDLRTGKVVKQFGPADGWATWHHHRCYREKATTCFLLTSRTGVEFIDTTTGELTPHHWIRGICRYGVLPANGLLYLPPDQCACYIQSKLHGFNALAPARQQGRKSEEGAERLERGPAYGQIPNPKSKIENSEDWPTYRRDAARSGYLPAQIKPSLKESWRTKLGAKLTSLVCAEGKLLVAQPDSHTVICLDADSGKELWRFTVGGRVDSPPTLAKDLAVFGSRDGCVYALRASDGALAWRFRAAPQDQRLVAYEQPESVWPVHGSTLVEGDAVYVAAGRNSYFDGGVWLYKLDLATGKPLLSKRYYSRDEKTGLRVNLFPPFQGKVLPDRELPGLLPDVFSADDDHLYLRSVALTRDLSLIGTGKPHLFCSVGFVEEPAWERTYWLFGTHMYSGARGWGAARTVEPAGRILVFDDKQVFGFDDATSRLGLALFAAAKIPKNKVLPDLGGKAKQDARRAKRTRPATPEDDEDAERGLLLAQFPFDWRKKTTVNVRAMVLTPELLFIAGPERFDEQAAAAELRACRTDEASLSPLLSDALASIEGKKGAWLHAVNKNDGKRLAEWKLDSAPVFDGMIAARGKLYISTMDGHVLCLVERN